MNDMQPTPPTPPTEVEILPIVEERLTLSRKVEETGAVRVRIVSERFEEQIELERLEHTAEIERVAIDPRVEERREPWNEGDVLVVPVYREVAVVERRLMLVEELHIRRRSTRSLVQEVVPVVRQRAVVERRGVDGSWTESGHSVDPSTQSGE